MRLFGASWRRKKPRAEEQLAEQEDAEVAAEMKQIEGMEDGTRKTLALKALNLVKNKADQHHKEAKAKMDEYEKKSNDIDTDPTAAKVIRAEEEAIIEKYEKLNAQLKAAFQELHDEYS